MKLGQDRRSSPTLTSGDIDLPFDMDMWTAQKTLFEREGVDFEQFMVEVATQADAGPQSSNVPIGF